MIACQKALFSIPQNRHYLNCAYMSPLSRRVEEAGVEGVRRKAAPWTIGEADFFEEADRVRELFAQLIHAPDPAQVAIIPAASYGLAQVARNTPLAPGENVVTVAEEFPSNVYIWRRLVADTGAELRAVGPPGVLPVFDDDTDALTEAMLAAIDDATRIVAVAQVNWADGTLLDLERVGERARAVGAALVIDGSQSVGAMDLDVTRIRPDALVCPAYKWLTGPYSIGVAWFSERYNGGSPIEESWIVREGADDFAGLVHYTDGYRPGAVRYDVGETSNFALMPMLAVGLAQVLEWTPAAIQDYTRALTCDFAAAARERGFAVPDESRRAGHLFGLRFPGGVDPEDVKRRLADAGVFVSVRGNAVRISAHLFNDEADVAALCRALFEESA